MPFYVPYEATADDLVEIAKNHENNESILVEIANHRNAPADLLDELSDSLSPKVKAAVAGNPNTRQEILEELFDYPNQEVRARLAANPSTPDDTLRDIVYDENNDLATRLAVAENYKAPPDILRDVWYMIQKESGYVKLFSEISKACVDEAIMRLAENPNTPEPILMRIACLNHWESEVFLLENENITPNVLAILCDSVHAYSRKQAKKMLEKLGQ